jgi:hypothetical protein
VEPALVHDFLDNHAMDGARESPRWPYSSAIARYWRRKNIFSVVTPGGIFVKEQSCYSGLLFDRY